MVNSVAANHDTSEVVASYGYRIYSIPYGYVTGDSGQLLTDRFAVADPLDGPDGFYLTVETIEDARSNMEAFLPALAKESEL